MKHIEPRVVLSVASGHSPIAKRDFLWGTMVEPISVGASADWPVRAAAVDAVHLFLSFDGYRLQVASMSPAHQVLVDGVAIASGWTHVPVPAVIAFGAASIAVTFEDAGRSAATSIAPRPIIDLSRPDRQPTQVLDLSRTLQLHTQRLEIPEAMLAELREVAAPAPIAQTQASAPETAASPQRGDTLIFQTAPVQPLALTRPNQLDRSPIQAGLANTLYDGGALRERAAELANVGASETPVVCAQSERTPGANRSLRLLKRGVAAFRVSSWQKQLTIALLPLAVASIWAMNAESAPATNTRARQPKAAATAPVAAAASGRPEPPAADDRATNATNATNATDATAARVPLPPETPPLPHDPSERLALIAAFSGNKAEAAALYDRLAASRNSRIFALAARLTREDRVRKP